MIKKGRVTVSRTEDAMIAAIARTNALTVLTRDTRPASPIAALRSPIPGGQK
jgi:predicted nucleic acid-binding protein